MNKPAFQNGHFYSPIVNIKEIKADESRIWPERPTIHGIDFNDKGHLDFIDFCHTIMPEFDYPYEPNPELKGWEFYFNNSQFSYLDPHVLFAMLRRRKPKRMIEIGSGFSSLLTADVNRNFLNNSLNFSCIEPYPREFLTKRIEGISEVIVDKVMNVPIDYFQELDKGDILFIDSSHVCKTGSDVNHIYFNIIPTLKKGVHIHIHDIFFPFDYKKEWVIDERRSWSEQYLLQAMLMYSNRFEVTFGCNYATFYFPDKIKSMLNGKFYGGSSFWIKTL